MKCPKCGATFEAAAPASVEESKDLQPSTGGIEAPPAIIPRPVAVEDGDEGLRPLDGPSGRRARRDAEPSRGTLILTLGIVSIVLPVIGWIPGIVAIVMGRTDQKKIKSGQMDRNGADVTQAGWICGIIGTSLQSIFCLGCGVWITWLAIFAAALGNMNKTGSPRFNNPGVPKIVPIPPPGPQKN
ncbi:MAG TPA: hypothetical protein VGP68_18270 [Gemmataceae bacterium]|nr:hypothetical protein [Gemmataceae bacterium]